MKKSSIIINNFSYELKNSLYKSIIYTKWDYILDKSVYEHSNQILNDTNRIIFLDIIKYFDDKSEYFFDVIDEITKIDFTDLTSHKYDEIEKIKKKKIIHIIDRYE